MSHKVEADRVFFDHGPDQEIKPENNTVSFDQDTPASEITESDLELEAAIGATTDYGWDDQGPNGLDL